MSLFMCSHTVFEKFLLMKTYNNCSKFKFNLLAVVMFSPIFVVFEGSLEK